jgi:hypothetical protein
VTWNSLPDELKERTALLVDWREKDNYSAFPHYVLPYACHGIGDVRQWAIDKFMPKLVMLDDDLRFFQRRSDDLTKFESTSATALVELFESIERSLDSYALVGVSSREGANRNIEEWLYNTRLLRILAYRSDVLRKEGIRFDRVPVMEDFDVALQLLRKGYPNVCANWIVHNQGSSNEDGGCSTYRSMEVQAEAARKLVELHPDFVTLVTKTTKVAWNGQERTDVRISWKAAYCADRSFSVLD